MDDKRKAQKTLDASEQQLGKLEQQRDRLTAELETARGERQKVLRVLALGEGGSDKALAKIEADLSTLTARLEGTTALIAEAQTEAVAAREVLSRIALEEAAEERKRRTAELTERAWAKAGRIRDTWGELAAERGDLCVLLAELQELDRGAAQAIGGSFRPEANGDPLRVCLAKGWRVLTLDGNHAADVWSVLAMVPPPASEPFASREVIGAFELVQLAQAQPAGGGHAHAIT